MSDKISIPDGSTWNATDVANTINWITQILTGKSEISFSNMTGTSEPKLQAGGIVEVNGVLYSASAEKSNTGWSGIANSTQAYLYAVITSDNIVPTWSTTAPTWSDAKNGWYESGTTKKCMLTSYKDASGNYTLKRFLPQKKDSTVHGIETITSGSGNWTVPVGVTQIKATIVGAGGGGGAPTIDDGDDGGDTVFNGVTASGGNGGHEAYQAGNGLSGHASHDGLVAGNGGMGAVERLGDVRYSGTDGGGGKIKIEIMAVSPGSLLAYSIGSGGAGGNNGSYTGGNGGDGEIIIEY